MNENQLGVMLEHILDRVNVIAEGQKNLEEGQKNLEERFTGLEKKMDVRFDVVDQRLDRLETSVTEVVKYIAALDDSIYGHEQRINMIEKKIAINR